MPSLAVDGSGLQRVKCKSIKVPTPRIRGGAKEDDPVFTFLPKAKA